MPTTPGDRKLILPLSPIATLPPLPAVIASAPAPPMIAFWPVPAVIVSPPPMLGLVLVMVDRMVWLKPIQFQSSYDLGFQLQKYIAPLSPIIALSPLPVAMISAPAPPNR